MVFALSNQVGGGESVLRREGLRFARSEESFVLVKNFFFFELKSKILHLTPNSSHPSSHPKGKH